MFLQEIGLLCVWGMRPTGVKNSPADPEATGLETDKMSRKHVAAHFEALMGGNLPPYSRG